MIVSYVSDFGRDWNTECHVAAALEELGHEVVRVPEHGAWPAIAVGRFDLLLWTRSRRGDQAAQLAALARLRQRGVPTVSYHLDRWFGLGREHEVESDPFFRTDLVVTADGGHADRFQSLGIRHAWLPPAVHGPEVGRGTPQARFDADVCFVGNAAYPHHEWSEERHRLVTFLAERYGDRFALWPTSPRQPIRGRDLNDLFASVKVVVGDSCLAGGATHYWSDRVPETMGRGGFLIHPHVDGMDDWYRDGEHLVTFDLGDLAQLGDTIDLWLAASPTMRQAVTGRALDLVDSRDTYRHRMARVLEMVTEAPVRAGWLDGRAGVVEARHESRMFGGESTTVGRFDLRPATTDGTAVREVWQQDSYRLRREDVAGGLVVDVGAHVGAFTILAAKLGAAAVMAVEPSPTNAARLRANLALNEVEDRVVVHESGICDDCDELVLHDDGSGSHLVDPESGGTSVRTFALDEIVAAADEIAFLKLDCEGCEYLSLRSLHRMLPRVRRMAMEFHGPKMPHLTHLDEANFGALCVVLAERGTFEVQGRSSTGGMIYWRRHE